MPTFKVCSRCKECKPLEEFHKKRGNPDGCANYCKACNVLYQREYRATDKGKRAAKAVQLRAKFGMTIEQYEEMYEAQGGLCACCGQPESALSAWRLSPVVGDVSPQGAVKLLAVDHDHETGEVRGLLCQNCNIGIGHFRTVDQLEMALAYLRSAHETQTAISG